ncbi:hypothetical protein E2C01_006392 [Portunus trituberculatus]|uniref:Uncharacterized protein n=1 Tax=Portunus trituberculatus TaxID=210409 RepID=A0A5B7CW89_PORTR|nr:hypothetical protein [Portunus trituberculatus]
MKEYGKLYYTTHENISFILFCSTELMLLHDLYVLVLDGLQFIDPGLGMVKAVHGHLEGLLGVVAGPLVCLAC